MGCPVDAAYLFGSALLRTQGRCIVGFVAGRVSLLAALAAIAIAAAGCGGGTRTRTTTAAVRLTRVVERSPGPADGLRATIGYASYKGCSFSRGCSGAVPPDLRRPLRLPHLSPGMTCPVSRAQPLGAFVGPGLGPGPVYPIIGDSGVLRFNYPASQSSQSPFAGSKWGGQKVLWVAAPSYRGPVLMRGRQLDGPHAIGFGAAAVPVADMQLLAPGASSPGEPPGWREWPSYTRLRAGGCYAYQVDGASFSTVIVFRAVAPFPQGSEGRRSRAPHGSQGAPRRRDRQRSLRRLAGRRAHAVDSLIGQRGGAYARRGSCGLDHQIKWWDQWTANGEPALTVYFRHSTFVGYQFGDLDAPRRLPPACLEAHDQSRSWRG